ncbi:MAG: hypothetical protein ACJ762_20065 [Solirubrobacteraceae bacterium]
MNFLVAIRHDLVEKRLWPVALALVLALIAVPLLLGRSAAAPTAPLPDPTVTAPAVKGTTQALVLTKPVDRRPVGSPKDPFAHAKAPKDDSTAATPAIGATTVVPADDQTTTPPSTSATSGGATTVTPSTGGPATTVPAPTTAPGLAGFPDSPEAHAAGYRVDVDWGPATAPKSRRDLVRLGALDVNEDPAVLFLGVRPDGKTVLFLLAADTTTGTGDARCRPTADLCSLLELRAGDSEFLDIVTPDGVRQFELHVDKVTEKTAATAAEAKERLARHSKAGDELVDDVIAGGRTFVRRYVYSTGSGVVKFVPDDAARAKSRGALVAAE